MCDFADEIMRLKEENERIGSQPDSIVLYGSSTFTLWKQEDIERDLPGYRIINRGFGGSYAGIALEYLDEVLLPLQPKAVFYYEGSNDIALGQSPQESFSSTLKIYSKLKQSNPEIIWIIMLVHFCPGRTVYHDKFQMLNDLYAGFCRDNKNCHIIDPNTFVCDDSGRIDKTIYLEDGIHFNELGNAKLGALVASRFQDIFR